MSNAANISAQTSQSQPSTGSLAMIRTLGGVATLSGVLLALVYQATFAIIEENKQEKVREAVFAVIPDATQQVRFVLQESNKLRPADGGKASDGAALFGGYDGQGRLVGVAIEASGQGYGDIIRVIYGYAPEESQLTGLKVLESKETPGLGDRISSEEFRENFQGMDMALNAGKSGLVHPIEFVKHGNKTEPWQVDGISGATISSKAVTKMVRESTQKVLPVVRANLSVLKQNAPEPGNKKGGDN